METIKITLGLQTARIGAEILNDSPWVRKGIEWTSSNTFEFDKEDEDLELGIEEILIKSDVDYLVEYGNKTADIKSDVDYLSEFIS